MIERPRSCSVLEAACLLLFQSDARILKDSWRAAGLQPVWESWRSWIDNLPAKVRASRQRAMFPSSLSFNGPDLRWVFQPQTIGYENPSQEFPAAGGLWFQMWSSWQPRLAITPGEGPATEPDSLSSIPGTHMTSSDCLLISTHML